MSSSRDQPEPSPSLDETSPRNMPGVQQDLLTRDLQDVTGSEPIPADFLRSDPDAHLRFDGGKCARDWTLAIEPNFEGERPARMGLELEMFVHDKKTLLPLGMAGASPDLSSQVLLKRLAERYVSSGLGEAKLVSDPPEAGVPETVYGLLLSEGIGYSIEPGGQLEVATPPAVTLGEVRASLRRALELIEEVAEDRVLFVSLGTNPVTRPDFGLQIPKKRYRILTKYFESESGGRGIDMMRHACTVQPNIDVGPDVAAWAHAVQLSYELSEPFKILFPNAHWFQGRFFPDGLERQRIWQGIDHSRTGEPGGIKDTLDMSCLYATWAAQAYVFWVEGLPEEEQPRFGELSFAAWRKQGYKGLHPSLADWERHLATLFPDVRLRGFLELRMFDAQPFDQLIPLLALVRGLLQSPRGREHVRQALPALRASVSTGGLVERREHMFKILREIATIGLTDLGQLDATDGVALLAKLRLSSPEDFEASSPLDFVERVGTTSPSRLV